MTRAQTQVARGWRAPAMPLALCGLALVTLVHQLENEWAWRVRFSEGAFPIGDLRPTDYPNLDALVDHWRHEERDLPGLVRAPIRPRPCRPATGRQQRPGPVALPALRRQPRHAAVRRDGGATHAPWVFAGRDRLPRRLLEPAHPDEAVAFRLTPSPPCWFGRSTATSGPESS